MRTLTVGMVYHDLTSMLGVELLGWAARASAGGAAVRLDGAARPVDKLVHRFLASRRFSPCGSGNGDMPRLKDIRPLNSRDGADHQARRIAAADGLASTSEASTGV